MSTLQFTCPLIVTIPGQLIASSLWNNEFTNIFTNGNPTGIGAYSDTDPQMQTSTDPFPSGSTSRPTALSGEIERIRYILNLIIGQTYWYQHPTVSISDLNSVIPSGTQMLFYQASAPTGWTAVSVSNRFLRVVATGGTGGTTGGSGLIPSDTITLAHSHTVNSHTHDISTHAHLMKNHTHTSAAHTHTIPRNAGSSNFHNPPVAGELIMAKDTTSLGASLQAVAADFTSGSTTPGVTGAPSDNTTNASDTANTGAATPGTDSQLTNTAFQYADVIIASKN